MMQEGAEANRALELYRPYQRRQAQHGLDSPPGGGDFGLDR
jgi:hypothetical protein